MRREDIARKKSAEDEAKRQELAKKAAEEKAKAEAEAKAKAEADAKAAAAGTASSGAASTGGGAAAGKSGGPATEDARRQSQQHYLSGMIYYQKQDYEKARDEWSLAKQLDPGNSDAAAGLERIEKIYSGGQ